VVHEFSKNKLKKPTKKANALQCWRQSTAFRLAGQRRPGQKQMQPHFDQSKNGHEKPTGASWRGKAQVKPMFHSSKFL